MTAKHKTLKGDEFWTRCPFCGDSESNPDKAHFSVNLTKGVYSCHRCQASGRLSSKDYLIYMSQVPDSTYSVKLFGSFKELPEPLPGPAFRRPSLLERGHIEYQGFQWDTFDMRNPISGEMIGLHLRRPYAAYNFGSKGYGWVGKRVLTSSADSPLRVVEGPYDILETKDICVFGTITESTLLPLRAHYLILTPDGDVWKDPLLRQQFLKTILSPRIQMTLAIVGIEYISEGLDPDQVPPSERIFIAKEEFPRFFRLAIRDKRRRFEIMLQGV